jgi:hypothetical protein
MFNPNPQCDGIWRVRPRGGHEGKAFINGMYFVFIYENRKMKPFEIVLRRREGGR